HPKFNFVVNTEKEIIGKIKVLQVDDTLSFGTVIMEKQRHAIDRGAKIDSLEVISYSGNDAGLVPAGEQDLQDRQDAKVAFGEGAKAWKPMSEPSLGQVGARL